MYIHIYKNVSGRAFGGKNLRVFCPSKCHLGVLSTPLRVLGVLCALLAVLSAYLSMLSASQSAKSASKSA